jgi:hypothetical protein
MLDSPPQFASKMDEYLSDIVQTQECVRQSALAHLLIELCRREVMVHHGGLEPCIRHSAQEAAALVRECGNMLLDVGRLFTASE